MLISIENFFIASLGEFTEIFSIPEGFSLFFTSKYNGIDSSWYYTNEDKTLLIRVSNHWGSGISQCNWYLKGYHKSNSYNWTTTNIGLIAFSDLRDISL